MKVTVTFETNTNEDGHDEVVSITREDVTDVCELLALYTRGAKAAGFDYWDRTAYATGRGTIHWEKF